MDLLAPLTGLRAEGLLNAITLGAILLQEIVLLLARSRRKLPADLRDQIDRSLGALTLPQTPIHAKSE